MLNNAKPNKEMQELMLEAEQGESIYSPEDDVIIKAIMYEGISHGENFDRIYEKKLKDQFPLPSGPNLNGLVNSHIHLRQLYQDMAKKYKKEVQVDKDILFEQVYTRFEQLYWNEADKHDIEGQRRTLMQLKDLIKHALSEKALDKAEQNPEGTTFHLDFGL